MHRGNWLGWISHMQHHGLNIRVLAVALDKASQSLTAFTCPGKVQFQYIVLGMGLKACPGSFKRMMELTVAKISNTSSHEQHVEILQKEFNRI